jgi:hypothetical protein
VLLAVSAFTKKTEITPPPRSGWPSVAGTITRFESGVDTRLSTVARYAAIGFKLRWSIDPLDHTTEGSATTGRPLEPNMTQEVTPWRILCRTSSPPVKHQGWASSQPVNTTARLLRLG